MQTGRSLFSLNCGSRVKEPLPYKIDDKNGCALVRCCTECISLQSKLLSNHCAESPSLSANAAFIFAKVDFEWFSRSELTFT